MATSTKIMDHEIFLETERLILRRFTREDGPLLVELDSDPEVMRYISKGAPTPRERVENEILPRLLRFYEEHDHLGYWAAHEKTGGAFLGWFHFRPDRMWPEEMELGYRLKRSAWGRGYATEGCRALIHQAFTEWGMEKVTASTLAGNAASRRVMEKSGLRFEREFLYDEALLPGWSRDERRAVKYGLAAEHWPGPRQTARAPGEGLKSLATS